MLINEVEIILYVSDQRRSAEFYIRLLGLDPVLDVPGMTEFLLTRNIKLGLMPEQGIKRILGDKMPDPGSGNGIPRCELYLKVIGIEKTFSDAIEAGAIEISAVSLRDWGDRVGYLADPDGHIIALAETPL